MLARALSPYSGAAFAALRIVAGLTFSLHGMQKMFGVLGGSVPPMWSQLWFAGLIELVAGLGIALGLFTVILAFLASGEMAVAYIQVHWKFQFSDQFFPIVNQGELALLYCFLFLYVACHGPGAASIDGMRSKPATKD